MPEKTCSICHNKFHLHEHTSGLVFDEHMFVCQDCCEHTDEAEFEQWKASKMQDPDVGMPIGLWLIHEQNKDKPLFTTKKTDS